MTSVVTTLLTNWWQRREKLAERRRALDYPPYAHLVRILCTGPALEPVVRALEELKAGIGDPGLLGPAPLLRLRGRYRAQLVGKTDQPRRLASRAARLEPVQALRYE